MIADPDGVELPLWIQCSAVLVRVSRKANRMGLLTHSASREVNRQLGPFAY